MIAKVIDTNVLIVANGKAEQASLECQPNCNKALEETRRTLIVIDDGFRILNEYQHKVNPSGQPGPGDAFLKWLLQNRSDPERCEAVRLTPNDRNSFDEFPDEPDLALFDPSDHKFVAVAKSSRHKPKILNAVDSDWWNFRDVLMRNHIHVSFICPDQEAKWAQK